MAELAKAQIFRLKKRKSDEKGDAGEAEVEGKPIVVQFNPQSLKLTLANQTSDGKTQGNQARQFLGKSSTELGFELQFDSADEGRDGAPVSVREKTHPVEMLLRPDPADTDSKVPARVRFLWGDLRVDGLISSLSIDFELFAADGVPLRAKMSVAIKEQDSQYESWQQREAKKQSKPAPGASPGKAGGTGLDFSDRTGFALGGETAADFAVRMGLDPQAWRGLAGAVGNPLSLTAGLEIDFSGSLSLSGGLAIGGTAGFEFNAGASLEASFGLTAGVSAAAAVETSGFTVAAAGGVSAALETVKTLKAEVAQSGAREAFSAPASAVRSGQVGAGSLPEAVRLSARQGLGARPQAPDQRRPPLRLDKSTVPSASTATPLVPRADPRALSYGAGVPLRPLVGAPSSASVIVQTRVPRAEVRTAVRAPGGCAGGGGCGCGCGCGGSR